MPRRTKPDSERGPHGAWLRRERLARKWRARDVVRALADYDLDVGEAYIRTLEAGPKPPGPEVQEALEAIFGSRPEWVGDPVDIGAELQKLQAQLDRIEASLAGPTEDEFLARVRAEREAWDQRINSESPTSGSPSKRK